MPHVSSPCSEEFVNAVKLMRNAWVSTAKSLESYGAMSGALSMIAGAVYWLVILIVVLSIFGVNFLSVWAPLSTMVIGLSFALGPAFQNLVRGEGGNGGGGVGARQRDVVGGFRVPCGRAHSLSALLTPRSHRYVALHPLPPPLPLS
jgi:hypothetical protein